MIEGVKITPLCQILDERGKVMHMLRRDDPHFEQFGEIYFSCIHPGAVKAWKLHKEMTLNCAVPYGSVQFVLYDDRKNSASFSQIQEVFLSVDQYCLVTVPPLVWTGFMNIGKEVAILANCASLPHSPSECERRDMDCSFIPYVWKV